MLFYTLERVVLAAVIGNSVHLRTGVILSMILVFILLAWAFSQLKAVHPEIRGDPSIVALLLPLPGCFKLSLLYCNCPSVFALVFSRLSSSGL